MPTAKKGFQVVNLHPKKHIFKKLPFLMYFCLSFTIAFSVDAADIGSFIIELLNRIQLNLLLHNFFVVSRDIA